MSVLAVSGLLVAVVVAVVLAGLFVTLWALTAMSALADDEAERVRGERRS